MTAGRSWWMCGRAVAVAAAIAVAGCNVVPARMGEPPPPQAQGMAQIPGYARIRTYGDAMIPSPSAPDELDQALHQRLASGERLDLLALSGGGDAGAYGAGFLKGWSERGDRPEFAVVTGVSTGALIAPMAFLGPAHDGALERFYTQTQADDIYRLRILDVLGGASALADSGPLERRIAEVVTPDLVEAIARERRKGRVLLIGTTDLDAQRQVIWDIGRIAASGQPDRVALIRRVLLASASIPAAFPPVVFDVVRDGRFYQELHVDGGVTRGIFAYPANYPVPPKRGPRNMWLIRNSKLAPEWSATRATAVGIAERSIDTMIKSQYRGELRTIQQTAARDGFELRVTAVPPRFPVPYAKPFDPVYTRALYAVGLASGRSGRGWGTPAELGAP
ncbi:MAG TPA: patatin-like phospholipase family protein [Paracoccus sp. (in: a-proteobacteria)]|nr:patatin-like phospholipase family protein [Paracoccus sp. (in: a-proteobacteria)]